MNTKLAKLRVAPSASLLEVMACIDRNGKGIALVMTEDGKLMGTVTDGDIRRAVLRGGTLASSVAPYMQKRFTAVSPLEGRAAVLDLMQARQLRHVPAVDAKGRLVGLHLLQELLGKVDRPNVAVIMAGGLGTRLRPVTEHIPKPMIKVAGRPILERVVLHLVSCGIRHVFLSVHYLGHMIESHFGDGARFGCTIEYLREKESLGTGGALSMLKKLPADPLIVMNGDLITQANIAMMLRFHVAGGYAATMAVRRYGHEVPFGCVEIKRRRIIRLEEKPLIERAINAGIYVLNPTLVRRIPRRFFPMTELFELCLARGEPVGAFEVEDEWLDIGQRDQIRLGKVI